MKAKLVVFIIAVVCFSFFSALLRPNFHAIMIIGVAVLLFFTPLADQWIRRQQAFALLFADDGVFHNQGRAGWADKLAYADVEAFHLERTRGRLWLLSVIRCRNKLSQGTWVEGFTSMDDDAAAAFEQDIQTRIKIAKDQTTGIAVETSFKSAP